MTWENLTLTNGFLDEVGKRYSFFYILGCVASAFSGILAFGLMQMKGVAGLAGWRCRFSRHWSSRLT